MIRRTTRSQRGTQGRRAGGGPVEAIARIKKRWPQAWADIDLRDEFLRAARDINSYDFPIRYSSRHEQIANQQVVLKVLAAQTPSRQDNLLLWIFREVRRQAQMLQVYADSTTYIARFPRIDPALAPALHKLGFDTVEQFAQEKQQRREALQQMPTIRDWFVAARPNIWDFTAGEAFAAAKEWHDKLEIKKSKRSAKKAKEAFTQLVLRGPWGEWRGIPQESVRQAPGPLMAVGKMLGHCTQQQWGARNYGVDAWTVVLWSRDGWPRAAVTFSYDPSSPEADRYRHEDNFVVEGSSKRIQNQDIAYGDPEGPATEALLRKVLGAVGARWGEAISALNPLNLTSEDRIGLASAYVDDGQVWDYLEDPAYRFNWGDWEFDVHREKGVLLVSAAFDNWFDVQGQISAHNYDHLSHGAQAQFDALEEKIGGERYEIEQHIDEYLWRFFPPSAWPQGLTNIGEDNTLRLQAQVSLVTGMTFSEDAFWGDIGKNGIDQVTKGMDWYLGGRGYAWEHSDALEKAIGYRYLLEVKEDPAAAAEFKRVYQWREIAGHYGSRPPKGWTLKKWEAEQKRGTANRRRRSGRSSSQPRRRTRRWRR